MSAGRTFRERRIAAGVERLGALLDAHPNLADRTRRALAGSLPCPDLEDLAMRAEHQTLRLAPELLERAERLIPSVSRDARVSAGGAVTRSTILRLALVRGVEALEQEYGEAKPARSSSSRTSGAKRKPASR